MWIYNKYQKEFIKNLSSEFLNFYFFFKNIKDGKNIEDSIEKLNFCWENDLFEIFKYNFRKINNISKKQKKYYKEYEETPNCNGFFNSNEFILDVDYMFDKLKEIKEWQKDNKKIIIDLDY